MEIILSSTAKELGQKAASAAAKWINRAIQEKGSARIVLSTGASQFTTLEALVRENVDWSKVEMFHLDEYIGIDETHPASFVKYLKERFVQKIPLKPLRFLLCLMDIGTFMNLNNFEAARTYMITCALFTMVFVNTTPYIP